MKIRKAAPVTAASVLTVDEFLDWHEAPGNYEKFRPKFEEIYAILDKYDPGQADIAYEKASDKDKAAVTAIIEGATLSGYEVLNHILNQPFSYEIHDTELTLTGKRSGRSIMIDLARLNRENIDMIADY